MRSLALAALLISCGSKEEAKGPGSGSAPPAGDAAPVRPIDTFSDDARRLFHCAAASGDPDLIVEANVKLGLGNANGTPNDKLAPFAQGQPAWTKQNAQFATDHADAAVAAACARERLK